MAQPSHNIRVLVADDQPIARQGIAAVLLEAPGMSLMAEASSTPDVIAKITELRPDVVVIDIDVTSPSGISTIRQIVNDALGTSVIIFTDIDREDAIFCALEAGASAYLLKTADINDILDAIRAAHAGEVFVSQTMTTKFISDFVRHIQASSSENPLQILSGRERQVFLLLAEGHTNDEIASRLGISPNSVKTYRQRITGKLGPKNKAELIKYAMRRGVIT